VDSIDYWAGKVRELEAAIVRARAAALAAPPCASYFVFFTNQADAAIAAQVNLHPEDGHAFHVVEAPGPEEVRCRDGRVQGLWLGFGGYIEGSGVVNPNRWDDASGRQVCDRVQGMG
jgi:hypothetical protein